MRKILRPIWLIVAIVATGCFDGEVSPNFDDGRGTSQGGSLARFTIVDDYLYVVNDFNLVPVDISDLAAPVARETIDLGFGVETIFPYQGNLFIGSASAVYIFSIEDDPASPRQRSVYTHSTGCDPVVVSGNYAYVTLREGFACNNPFQINVLEVVDVSNLDFPEQVNSIPMTNPRGLGVGCNGKLFVCEGPGGLVQFNLDDPTDPREERIYNEHAANDVLIRGDLVIVTGTDGIYQYSCASNELELLSVLPLAL